MNERPSPSARLHNTDARNVRARKRMLKSTVPVLASFYLELYRREPGLYSPRYPAKEGHYDDKECHPLATHFTPRFWPPFFFSRSFRNPPPACRRREVLFMYLPRAAVPSIFPRLPTDSSSLRLPENLRRCATNVYWLVGSAILAAMRFEIAYSK